MKKIDQKRLLDKHAPIVKFTKGEAFLPTQIDTYLKHCSLVAHVPNGGDLQLVKKGKVTIEALTKDYHLPKGAVLHLRLTEDLNLKDSVQVISDITNWRKKKENAFKTDQGRLVRVGYISRCIDALFSLTLILRGKVPGLASNIAADDFIKDYKHHKEITYYGHVVEDKKTGWVALQYWFFYYFNDWRSTFSGVNDHESDWEMMTVYVYKNKKGEYVPEWTAYASHDYHGNDIRRRFDDSQVEKVGSHPVVYAGVGSHASYYLRGEYLSNFPIPTPRIFARPLEAFNVFWRRHFYVGEGIKLTIPFIDYARGDGVVVGHRQKNKVTVRQISDQTKWVDSYKGLWGHFAQDPLSGENAPAGPKYNRDGSVRLAWRDPFTFAGLDSVPTPVQMLPSLKKEIKVLTQECDFYKTEIARLQRDINKVTLRLSAMSMISERIENSLQDQEKLLRKQLEDSYESLLDREAILEGLKQKMDLIKKGQKENPHAHIKHMAKPTTPLSIRFGKVTEIWAALSIAIILLSLIATVIFFPNYIILEGLIVIYLFSITESVLRRTYAKTLSGISLSLAVIACFILVFHFWQTMIMIFLITAAIYLLFYNIREVRRVLS